MLLVTVEIVATDMLFKNPNVIIIFELLLMVQVIGNTMNSMVSSVINGKSAILFRNRANSEGADIFSGIPDRYEEC